MAPIVIGWLGIDQLTKSLVEAFAPGDLIAGPFLGVFDLALVHNTGAAWGIFSGNPIALGAFSVLICIAAILYLLLVRPPASILTTIGLSLVVSGGLGNAIDRFANGYVIDFIRPVFIDFPVFNIADIGVTIGVVFFIIGLILEFKRMPGKSVSPNVGG